MERYGGYQRPVLPEGIEVKDLSRSVSAGPVKEPAPEERVICINRGNKVLKETFNGEHSEIPPGYFEIEYQAALHFKRKLIVPGSKNIETGGWVSFIGILGVDPQTECEPFTEEECALFGERFEAIDRSQMLNARDRDVQVVRTNAAIASSPGYGQRGIDVNAQANDAAAAAAEGVLDRPDESLTAADEAGAGRPTAPRRAPTAKGVRK